MPEKFKFDLNWIYYLKLFIFYFSTMCVFFVNSASWKAITFLVVYGICGGLGITAGVHRCFCHRSFKANKPLKLLLLFFQTISFQRSAIEWIAKHRVHHKYADTDSDPHSPVHGLRLARCTLVGFKYTIDDFKNIFKIHLSDVENDPWLQFQYRFYTPIVFCANMLLPIVIGTQIFGENIITMWCYNSARIMYFYHSSMLISLLGHSSGKRPYDSSTSASESILGSFISLGEGWHNYHHAFPYDYKSKECNSYFLNFTKAFIDFFAWIGWATDLKIASDETIKNRVLRTGDGSHRYFKEKINN